MTNHQHTARLDEGGERVRLSHPATEARAWLYLHIRGETGLPHIDSYEAIRHALEVLNGHPPTKRSLPEAARSVQALDDPEIRAALTPHSEEGTRG